MFEAMFGEMFGEMFAYLPGSMFGLKLAWLPNPVRARPVGCGARDGRGSGQGRSLPPAEGPGRRRWPGCPAAAGVGPVPFSYGNPELESLQSLPTEMNRL
ncbi:hypothetical protein GCM10027168_58480 [Streptomyces capparidis]